MMMQAPDAVGFNLGTLQLEYMAAFFYLSTALALVYALGAESSFNLFWAWGAGGMCGTLCKGADFNPSVSVAKFMIGGNKDIMKLVCRILGQILGCLSACMGLWLMSADSKRTGFFPPQVLDDGVYKDYNAFFAVFLASGPGIWLLEAYGDKVVDRRLAHFITYGYQAAWQYPLVGNGFNWADALARGLMGYITGDANGAKDGFDGGDFWGAMWMILVAGGVLAPAFAWFFTTIQWPMIEGFSEKELAQQEAEGKRTAGTE